MRKTLRRNMYCKSNERLIFISFIFVLFIIVGAFLNKVYGNEIDSVSKEINALISYYNNNEAINMKDILLLNLAEYIRYLGLIGIFSLFFVTYPLAIIVFILKAVSIGYTINSCFLLLKFKSLKICILMLLKNIIVIPFSIILIMISIEYIKNISKELKKQDKESILFLVKRFLLNLVIIILISVVIQSILNIVSVRIIQFLAI